MQYLKQSTAADVMLGVFVNDADGKTTEEALTLAQADLQLSKNCGAAAQKAEATSATHIYGGNYKVPLDATDTGTLGRLDLMCKETGALPVKANFMVITANAYDSMCSTDKLEVDVTQIGGVVQSATDLKDLVDTGYDPATHKIQSDLIYIHGSALTETAGQLAAAFVKLFDVATPLLVASDVMVGTNGANTTTPPTVAAIVNEWESQSQADPTGFHVNVKEVNGTSQTANDNGADINTLITGVNVASKDNIDFGATEKTSIETAVNNKLVAQNLDHLCKVATAGADMTTEIADNTILSRILSNGDTSIFVPSTDGFQPIRDRGDTAWTTGGGGSISDILNVQPLIPNAIDRADTAIVRIGLGLTNMLDDMPGTAEITPGTITIDRKAIGGTSWVNIVNAAACSELAGLIYYDEVFDSGTGYAAGDTIRITFKSQKIVVAANDYEITGTDGWVFHTYVREAMRGTNSAYTGTPPTVTEIQTEMEENGASLLDTIRDIVSHATYGNSALQVLVAALQTDLDNGTDGLGALKTLIDSNKDHLTDIKGTGFVKDTDSLPQCLTATGFSTHNAAAVKTAIEAAGSHLTLIKAVSDALTSAVAAKMAKSGGTIVTGTAATGTLSTTEMTSNLSISVNDQYNGRILIFLSDTTTAALRGQATDITDTVTTNGKLTFTALTTAPSNGDTFCIV